MATFRNQNGTDASDILIYDQGASTVVYHAGAGYDKVSITGGSVKLELDSGSNTIDITGGAMHEITGGTGTGVEKLTINGGNTVTAKLGSGKDVIEITNSNGKKSTGALSAIRGGDWGDTFNVKVGTQGYQLYGEAGNDIFNVEAGKSMVYWGGAASDTFNIKGGTGKYYGGDSGDTFNVFAAGQELILGYGSDVVNIEAGDNQKIKANLGVNDIHLKAGSGHIITVDVDQTASKKKGYTDEQIKAGQGVGYGIDKVNIYAGVSNVTANLGDGKDEVTVNGTGHKIYTEGWSDTIALYEANSCYIDAGTGDDKVTGTKMKDTEVYLGEGNDIFETNALSNLSNSQVHGGKGKDKFIIYTGHECEFWGEAGNDEFQIIAGDNNSYYSGDGNDTFRLSGGDNNVLNLEQGNNTVILTGGTNTDVLTEKTGRLDLTISGQATTDSIAIRNEYTKLEAHEAANGIEGLFIDSSAKKVEAVLTDKKDKLMLYSGENIIDTGAGDDEVGCLALNNSVIELGRGNDIFEMQANWSWGSNSKVSGGDGNDTITVGGSTKNCEFSGNAGMDKFTVHSGTNNRFLGGGGADSFYIKGGSQNVYRGAIGRDTVLIEGATEFCVIRGDSDNDTILVEARNGSVYSSFITGDGSQDILEIRGNGNMLYGGSENDDITLYGDENLVYGGTEEDKCSIYGSSNLCYGGAGNDEFYVIGTKNTCYGGAGDDTLRVVKEKVSSFALLVGGNGSDTYKVQDQDNVWIDLRGNSSDDKDTIVVEGTKGMKYAYRWDELHGILAIGSIFVQGIQNLHEIRFISGGETEMSGSGLDLLKYAKTNNYYFEETRTLNNAYLDYGERGNAVAVGTLGEALEEVSSGIKATMVEIANSYK